MPCLEQNNFPPLIKDKSQQTYSLVANWDISKEIYKCGQESIDTFQGHIMHMYIHDTPIPKMLEGMSNGRNKAKLLENYGLTTLCQEKL